MGRLDHIKQSSAALLADPRIDGVHNHYLVVDYYCPDKTGQWLQETYGSRVTVLDLAKEAPLEKDERAIFHKPIANNSGAMWACQELNAQYLIFLDADTIVTPTLLDFLFHHASIDQFMIFEPSLKWRDLTGFLLVHKRAFIKVNGYDKDFMGWGAEDLEMRLKLYLKGRVPLDRPRALLERPDLYSMFWTEIPAILARSIEHSDERRVSNYVDKDKDLSHGKNLNLLCANVYQWLGVHPVDLHETPLGPRFRRLLGMDLLVNPRSVE